MQTVTFLQLQTDARFYFDDRGGTATSFVDPTELKRLINQVLKELYGLLVQAAGKDYYANEATIAILPNTPRYNLPTDFFEMLSVTLEWNAQQHEIVGRLPATKLRADYVNNYSTWQYKTPKRYWLRNQQIEFVPSPTVAVTCREQYVPVLAPLVNDADTFDGVNGWEKLVPLKVAMEVRAAEEQPLGALADLYEPLLESIREMASDRDNEEPSEITDVQPEGTLWPGKDLPWLLP